MDIESNHKWEQYFSDGCQISTHYVEVSDGSQVLIVKSIPPIKNNKCKPIILIPGWFSNARGWIGTLKEISKCTQVVFFETREKHSCKLVSKNADFSIERMAQDLRELEEQARNLRHENQLMEQKIVSTRSLTKLQYQAKELGFIEKPKMIMLSEDATVAHVIDSRQISL